MKATYHVLYRRKSERMLRLRLRGARDRGVEPLIDHFDELPTELIDLATGELAERRGRR
jgi:hypothetical protein